MTGLNLFSIQQAIVAYLKSSISQFEIVTGSVPTAESIPLINGRLVPYIVLRFSDMMPSAKGSSFIGSAYDEYYSYVDAICLGETDTDARELVNLVNGFMIGKVFPNSGEISKNYGGGIFAIASEANRQPIAYAAVTSYRYAFNLADVGAVPQLTA